MMVTLIEQDDRIVIGPPPRAPSDNGESSQSNKMDDDDKVLAAMGYAPVSTGCRLSTSLRNSLLFPLTIADIGMHEI